MKVLDGWRFALRAPSFCVTQPSTAAAPAAGTLRGRAGGAAVGWTLRSPADERAIYSTVSGFRAGGYERETHSWWRTELS